MSDVLPPPPRWIFDPCGRRLTSRNHGLSILRPRIENLIMINR